MQKKWIGCGILLLFWMFPLSADGIMGFWQTMDKNTHKPSSVIAFYSYEGKLYGKIIATYDKEGKIDDTLYHPTDRAPGISGNPYYCGLDIVWDGKPDGDGQR